MLISMKDLALDREKKLCEVPLSETNAEPIGEEEGSALLAFGAFAIEVPVAALPLQIYYVGGNREDLMIAPKAGRLEIDGGLAEIRNRARKRLQLMETPF